MMTTVNVSYYPEPQQVISHAGNDVNLCDI